MRFTALPRAFPILASAALLALPILFAPHSAQAANTIDVFIESPTITSPTSTTTGHLDVFISLPVGFNPQSLSFDAQVTLSPTSGGVTLLTPTPTTSNHPEVYSTSLSDFNSPGSTSTKSNASDDTGPSQVPITLNNGDGLFQINYSVAANTMGAFSLTFNAGASDIENGNIPAGDIPNVTFHTGTLTFVPEPASLALLGVGALGLISRRRASHAPDFALTEVFHLPPLQT